LLVGAPAGTPTVSDFDHPEWNKFADAYRAEFPDGFTSPTIFAHHYYMSAKAALLGLDQVNGDLSNNHKAYRAVLADLAFISPTGGIMRVDHNRNGIVDNFITEVFEKPDGTLGNKAIKVVSDVNQTLGMDADKFLALGPVSRDNPSCP
jgi:branched-chain amino acid transport system substrate-binding protein